VCVQVGGGDANTQAKQGALREESLTSRLITWKDRTGCESCCSDSTSQAARVSTAELPVPLPLRRARLQAGRGSGKAAAAAGTGDGLTMGSEQGSRPPHSFSSSLACDRGPACPQPTGKAAGGAAAPLLAATLHSRRGNLGGATALHSQVKSFCFKGTLPK